MGISNSIRKQLFATTILVAAGSIYGGYGRRAMAGSCTTTDVAPAHLNISCSLAANAVTDATQSFTSAGGFTIVDVPGFGLDTTTTGGYGLETNGGITTITITGDIHADDIGIYSTVYGAGATTTITNSGSIISDNAQGIYAGTDTGTGNVTISNAATGVIQADYAGIAASVNGEDAITTITNSGEITSDNRQGIYAYTDGDTGNVTISNAATGVIQAMFDGISAYVNGEDAATTISNSGSINSTLNGINAYTDADTGDVTISNEATGTILAFKNGIFANVDGEDAATTISNSGSITSIQHGINAVTDADTGDVTISNEADAIIDARVIGIFASVNGEDAITTITNSGEITSDYSYGIFASTGYASMGADTGDVTITNAADATIQAIFDGIRAVVQGEDAATTISNSGSITSVTQVGIRARTYTDTGDVTITNEATGTIQAYESGIFADVDGEDAITTITNRGSITSDAGNGISAGTDTDTGDVTITNAADATIQAFMHGIRASVRGEDAITTISNSGSITSVTLYGIYARAHTDTGDVTITNEATGTIQAGYSGIFANVRGEDAITTISNSGSITSATQFGIFAITEADTGDVMITNAADATIQANSDGIRAIVSGEDAITTISNSGSITADYLIGIYAITDANTGDVTISNAATGVIQAKNSGIKASVNGEDAIIMITNSGSITSDEDEGIFADTDGDTGNVTISNAATGVIQAKYSGIRANVDGEDAVTMITNSGMITSDNTQGIFAGTDTDTGDVTITNDATGVIQAYDYGIVANVRGEDAATTISNSGSITAAGDGIYAVAVVDTGDVTITNAADATIQAYGNGIDARVDGEDAITMITNSGSITAAGEGIYASTDADTGDVTITNAAGVIQALYHGIDADVDGADAITMITNSGSITSAIGDSILASTGAITGDVTITNAADATIQANNYGIFARVRGEDAATTISNSGSITSATRIGINARTYTDTGDVTITNEATGTIQADRNGIDARVYGEDAATTISNSGEITAVSYYGIFARTFTDTGDVTITNEATGVIQANYAGIYADVDGEDAITMITNSGSITSDNVGGIIARTFTDTGDVTITNEATGVIQAKYGGIFTSVRGEDAATRISNSGSITSDNGDGIFAATGADTGDVTITNDATGVIQAYDDGIVARVNGEDAIIMITNSGSITSDGDEGIFAFTDTDTGDVTITNEATGTIQAKYDGIFAYVNNSATTTITSSGTITSDNGDGIVFYGNYPTQDATVNIDVNNKIDAATGTGIWLNATSNTTEITSTINANSDADIDALIGIDVEVGDSSEVAVNIKAGASVIGTDNGILDTAVGGGISAKTTVILEGELGGNVDLGGNDDSFTMKGSGASLTAATTLIDGGDGEDAFNFDNVQMASGSVFTSAIDNFETIEFKNSSFVRVDSVTWTTDNIIINSGNTLEALGASNIIADLNNSGTVSLADGSVDDVLTINGDLSGSGTFILNANVDAPLTSDQIIVAGNVAGSHSLDLKILSNDGIDTGRGDTDGILLIDVIGTATASNFSLANGSVSGGVYSYGLHFSAGNDFYLQTTGLSNAASMIPSTARGSTLGADALMLGYNFRLSSRIEAPINPEQSNSDGNSFGADILHASEVDPANKYWMRLLGAHGEYDGRISAGRLGEDIETDADFGGIQLGVDFAMPDYPDTYATFWGHYLYQSNDVYNHTRNTKAGEATIRSGGVGLGITYDPGSGMYFDALASISFSQADIDVSSGSSDDTRGTEYIASAEIGYRYQTGYGNLTFIPQAQINTHIADFASFTDETGFRISDPESRRSTLRLGLSAEDTYQMSNGVLKLIGTVSWSDVFSSKTQADLGTTQVDLSDADEFIEGNLGMEYNMDDNSSVWANVNYKSGLGEFDSENTSIALGFSIKF